jgi:TatD DNase family protein
VADSHCHLDIELAVDKNGPGLTVDEAVKLAASVGIARVVQIGCDVAGAQWAVEVAERNEAVVAGVALHPNEAPRLAASGELHAALTDIEELAANDVVRAIGETGLDYYRTGVAGRDAQEHSFRWHIDLAKRLDKTLVIHDRDAHEDVVRVLLDEGAPNKVVFHCFSGGVELADVCAQHGWYMSFAGPVTFKANEHLRDALSRAPTDLVLVETDAPFLTPMPFRGRPNASYLIPLTVRAMAQVKGMSEADLCRAIDGNTTSAFGSW